MLRESFIHKTLVFLLCTAALSIASPDGSAENKVEIGETVPADNKIDAENKDTSPSNIINTIYVFITKPIVTILSLTKVSEVVYDVGACVVNGVWEIVTYYLPGPFIPIIASVASKLIPYEPVGILKEKYPVTNYRKAMGAAIRGFFHTFERYHENADPFMKRRFLKNDTHMSPQENHSEIVKYNVSIAENRTVHI